MLNKLRKMLNKEIVELKETEATQEDLNQMQQPANYDPDYLQYSAEAVGFANREQQWNTYRLVMNYITDAGSVLDFGAGRGDFMRFINVEFPEISESFLYTGIEMNEQLNRANDELSDNISDKIIRADWFDADDIDDAEWCINVNSSNLRYDANMTLDDAAYTKATIEKMYEHATRGVMLLLTTNVDKDSGLINHDAGDLLNWARQEFGNVAVDHTIAPDSFILLIYKN